MDQLQLLARLAHPAESRIVLLVLDGVGDIRTANQPETALEVASTPNLDALAARSALGRLLPVSPGVTPGSGPGHLALFGYDPTDPQTDIGRGVLEALGLGLELEPDHVVARGNFATADDDGRITDRRAGRISNSECRRLSTRLNQALQGAPAGGVEARVEPGEGHRFVLLLRGEKLSPQVSDTDPQQLGMPPLQPEAQAPEAVETVALLGKLIAVMQGAIAQEPKANRVLLRGFSQLPDLPQMTALYQVRCGAFAGYPLYRGVAAACGMEVVPTGKAIAAVIDAVAGRWQDFDFFFLHVKQTDQAGEDGNLRAKVEVLEEVDRSLPRLLELEPDVLAITGDHSTPVPLKAHSWHPVPLLLCSALCCVDPERQFSETAAARGHLGTFPSRQLMALLLANAGRLAKFGA